MKYRTLLVCLVAIPVARLIAADPQPAAATAATPVTVTTVKRTSVRVGNLSLPLNQGTKLEVLGRESESLVVKFRSGKGKVPASDTDFNPATMSVPTLAPEPAAKSADVTIAPTPPAADAAAQGQPPAGSKSTAKAKPAPGNQPQGNDKMAKPVKQQQPAAPPPVNN